MFWSYGYRTNAYLLQIYGFAFEDNAYDSYSFHVKLDLDFKKDFNAMHFLAPPGQVKNTQVIRLKKHQLNLILIAYLRKSTSASFFTGSKPSYILLSRPVDIKFEMSVLNHYLWLIKVQLDLQKTTLERDLELLEDKSLSNNMRMMIVYRVE